MHRTREQTEYSWAVRGALLALSPGVYGLAMAVPAAPLQTGVLRAGLSIAASCALAGASLLLKRARLAALAVAVLTCVSVAILTAGSLTSEPLLAFGVAVACLGVLGAMWLAPFSGVSREVEPQSGAVAAVRASAAVALSVAIGVLTTGGATTRWAALVSGLSLSVPICWGGFWGASVWRRQRARAIGMGAALLLALASGTALLLAPGGPSLAALSFAALLTLFVTPGSGLWTRIIEHPARLLVVTFASLCAAGTFLLSTPTATTSAHIGFADAVFTAVSAVCVTGLIVLDTPGDFTGFGQACLLFLIQVGGLGIMTFYTAALSALGGRLSLRQERAIAGALNVRNRARLSNTLRRVLIVTIVTEFAGAAVLIARFAAHGDPPGRAAWRGAFTSISAFCNAGFALQSDSLIPYQTDPLVLHTVAVLIVAGGLSPAAILALPRLVRGQRTTLGLRLIVVTSAALLVVGFVTFAAFEWTYSLAGLPVADRLHNAWFQSATLRTAGFNSVALDQTSAATRTLMVGMMFIGGSPGGTAGGIKTTTLAVLLLAVTAALKRRDEVAAFGKRIGHASVYKATAVVTLGILSALVALIAVQLTQTMTLEVAVFEVVSALGTVGLTVGGTSLLDGVGKGIIALCMFAGRTGPLTLFLFLSEHGHRPTWLYPEQEVDVG